ncbi:MAG: NAD-dependent epimerase/dehydratase family protein [Candidatus Omnitrophota bacterium]
MDIALITGSAGLIGSESARFFSKKSFKIVGIDNDMRSVFFGAEGSVKWNLEKIKKEITGYEHHNTDIRDESGIGDIFNKYGKDIKLIVHTAAQPSHDWAAKDPRMDFTVNANGTLNMLENARRYCPEAVFIFTSTNKVYGDTPNRLPLIERETRWEIDENHQYSGGIDEAMSIDNTKHSLFGVSKAGADMLTQEYGRYFGMSTVCFRGGCLTGPGHSGVELHGFLSYLMKCAITGREYIIYGYKGKQVRDNIHSHDLVNAFYHFYKSPKSAAVYNIGGGRHANCSILEAIKLCEDIAGKKMRYKYVDNNRAGDHIWWISGIDRFKNDYKAWNLTYDIPSILREIYNSELKKKS